jgi:hypothetical protein
MPKAYHIKDWDRDRENADTRKYVDLIWFRSKVKLLGEGLGHTLTQPDRQGPFLYGMFKIIEQIAAGGKLGERGWLIRNGSAMDAQRMGNLMRLPAPYFEEALAFFTKPPMDWIEHIEYSPSNAADQESAGRTPGESPGVPPSCADEQENVRRNAPSEERRTYNKEQRTSKREKENGGFASAEEGRRAQAAQFAALRSRISELESIPEEDRLPAEEADLKKTRGLLRGLQKKQAAGNFTPVREGEA